MPGARITYVKKDEDPRDYRVSFEKIRRELNFAISKTVPDGIVEIMDVITKGIIENTEEQRFYNIPH